MVSINTLKTYIDRCNNVLMEKSPDKSKELVKEIVVVFDNDYKGLKAGLTSYSFGVINGIVTPNYNKDLQLLKARLEKELEAIDPKLNQVDQGQYKEKKIFISHAQKDKDYVSAIVNLLESLGLREDEIICSSIPPYCVPLDNNVYDWLINEFQHCDLHVIFALSDTYYSRPVCLNEMGAAWATKQKWTAVLLPGFGFDRIAGCIDSAQISIKLDSCNDELKYRLDELKDELIEEFGLREISSPLWEKKRDAFLNTIMNTMANRGKEE